MQPFLKWAGGKRWLAKDVIAHMPKNRGRYIEPFLGGGAVFFELEPETSILSDCNCELIGLYQAIKDNHQKVRDALVRYTSCHSKEFYYLERAKEHADRFERAARFLYLNRTCWNGLYRVNKSNIFNVPIGTKTNIVYETDDFGRVARLLAKADLRNCDFQETIDAAKAGDVIYADPPYTVKHNLNGFVKYNDNIFSWDDQIRLRDSLLRASERGCHLIVSNADHESVKALYADFNIPVAVPRHSVIAGKSTGRAKTTEMLLVQHA